MDTRIWEHKKSALLPYRRRRPETTELYRVVYATRDDLPRVWEQRFQPDYGCLRDEVKNTLDAFLNCGILAHGCARFVCECCNTSIVVAFSCKKRGVCPSCSAKRALIFAEHLEKQVLLNAPHRHLVCSIPKRLRPYFRYKRSLLGKLQTAAWESYRQFIQELAPEALPGAILTHQTAGGSLNFNPHVHGKRSREIGETAAVLAVLSQDIDKRKASKSWAALIKRVFEIDPLLCPKCSGNMKMIHLRPYGCYGEQEAFITDTAEVNRLLKHLNVCPFLKPDPPSYTGPPPMDTDTSHILFAD